MKSFARALCVLAFGAASYAQTLETVLARMDSASAGFKAISAHVEMVTFNALLKDTAQESGTLEMQRLKPGDVRAVLTFTGAQGASPWIGFQGKTLRLYYPQLHTFEDIPAAKYGDALNQYLLLGFGSSGKELSQSYRINFAGREKVAGQETSKLVLDPKDAKVKKSLNQIIMWIPDDGGNPVQQQFYEPSGNYRMLTYTGITLNPKIKGTLELKLPSGARKEG